MKNTSIYAKNNPNKVLETNLDLYKSRTVSQFDLGPTYSDDLIKSRVSKLTSSHGRPGNQG